MKARTFIYHVSFWACLYALWVFAFSNYSLSVSKTMTVEFCYLLFITADYYIISNVFMPRLLLKGRYVLFGLLTMVVLAGSAWFRSLVALQMNLHIFHAPATPAIPQLYINSLVNICIWVAILILGKMVVDRIQGQQAMQLLEKERTLNELNFLKAQINPHALFNSLNTVYGQIDKHNHVARNTLLQFSELLRYQLYECAAEKVTLDKELEYIKNYVGFHQLRKDKTCMVDLITKNIDGNLMIAPLMLVVLIENAFKFVSNAPDRQNRIIIRLHTKDALLKVFVHNTTEPQISMSTTSKGIGIANLKRRLQLLYADKHELADTATNDFYETSLIVDLS